MSTIARGLVTAQRSRSAFMCCAVCTHVDVVLVHNSVILDVE